MNHVFRAAVLVGALGAAAAAGGVTLRARGLAGQSAPAAGQQPALPTPATPGQQTPGAPAPGAIDPAAPAVPLASRTFTASSGLLLSSVRPERAVDFEKFLAYLQAALAKTSDARVRAQAAGWKIFRATEPGPNNTVTFVFVLDPTVPEADYALGPILAEAYPDPAQLSEIWKLYTGSVTGGGFLLNLKPVMPVPPPPLLTPPVGGAVAPGPAPTAPRPPLPPDANPLGRE